MGLFQALPFRAARIAKVLCPGCPMPLAYARVSEANTFGKSAQLPHILPGLRLQKRPDYRAPDVHCVGTWPGPTVSICPTRRRGMHARLVKSRT